MTVSEFIKILAGLPQDYQIAIEETTDGIDGWPIYRQRDPHIETDDGIIWLI